MFKFGVRKDLKKNNNDKRRASSATHLRHFLATPRLLELETQPNTHGGTMIQKQHQIERSNSNHHIN